MSKLTVKATLAAIRATGCTAGRTQDGEYRIALPGQPASAYFTNDAQDAIGTAIKMVGRHNRSLAFDKVDIKVRDHGSIVMVEPVSAEAKHFVQAFVSIPDWAWHGNAFAVEPRYADDLLSGMASNGLNVAS